MELQLNTLYLCTIKNFGFDKLPQDRVVNLFKDGRVFSHFIEYWLERTFSNLTHIQGCKKYDFIDYNDNEQKYDEKTFTNNGCKFMPSNMIGGSRRFNQERFNEHCRFMRYILVDNTNFPNIRIKAFNGEVLANRYPKGKIFKKDIEKIFGSKTIVGLNTNNYLQETADNEAQAVVGIERNEMLNQQYE